MGEVRDSIALKPHGGDGRRLETASGGWAGFLVVWLFFVGVL